MCTDTLHDSERPLDSLDSVVERIRAELLEAYELSGAIDIAEWVRRYPSQRDEVIDFWIWLKATSPTSEVETGPFPVADADVAEKALRDACLAVNLGRQWLEPAVDPDADGLQVLAAQLESLRGRAIRQGAEKHAAFRKAVVWTWVVSELQLQRPRVTRLAVQKVTYLLESSMRLGVFVEHHQKALGPYDYKARYKDAEPIAVKKGWLKVRGATVRATDSLAEMKRFIGRYLRSEDLARRLTEYLGRFADEELETLATVVWSARDLVASGRPLTAEAVRQSLAETPEWRAKLDRPNFSVARVAEALSVIRTLRLVSA